MARIRSVYPGQWTDEAFVSLSPFARLLAIAIRTECDDRGVFEWKPITLKMRLLPADNVDMGALMAELAAADQIASYEIDGRQYGAVRNFCKFQRPKKPNYTHPVTDRVLNYVAFTEPNSPISGEPVGNPFGNSLADGVRVGDGEGSKKPSQKGERTGVVDLRERRA